ncbi:aldo/keto reductase [Paenibacillus sp. P96]|uniref:Aldo/keto reductase n=1 Tax=Paenibacillus zeirhizosphaerae TaxID=2987519 RepID=A0ABT9FTF5_9BACL|nr:aldo/keto reductase [Paenibacillus sp. P96]MDP4098018.1 aldo/keto reductase [Paenibacillus sp. P96]
MKKNRLGSSDLMVSEIGFGCMTIGTEGQKGVHLIHEALEKGINFLDTSDLYDSGRNEELVGKAVQGRRQDVIIATKVGNRRVPGQEGWVWDPSKAYILEAVKASLRRLGTDYIDLYQLHGGTLDDPIDETIEAFEQLKREGVIRWYGISSIRPNVIREYVKRSAIVSVMNQYSLLDRRAEEEVLPLLEKEGISLIARGPVASGVLAEGGASKAAKGYLNYEEAELLKVRERLAAFTGDQRSMEQLAIRYSLAHPAVATAIPGASSSEQLQHNVGAAAAQPLTEQEISELRSFTQANRYIQHR